MNKVQELNAIALKKFTLMRAKQKAFRRYSIEWGEYQDSITDYKEAEKRHQLARREAGLPYLLLGESE